MSAQNSHEELMVVHFLEPQEDGVVYNDSSAQHVTLLPSFIAERPISIGAIDAVAVNYSPIKAEVGEKIHFGRNRNIPVFRIEPKLAVKALHKALLLRLLAAAAIEITARNSSFVDDGYNPHTTIHDFDSPLMQGDSLTIDRPPLMARSTVTNQKQVIHQIKLGNE